MTPARRRSGAPDSQEPEAEVPEDGTQQAPIDTPASQAPIDTPASQGPPKPAPEPRTPDAPRAAAARPSPPGPAPRDGTQQAPIDTPASQAPVDTPAGGRPTGEAPDDGTRLLGPDGEPIAQHAPADTAGGSPAPRADAEQAARVRNPHRPWPD